jgi:GNAT superfamily N-acetyltransferase
MDLNHEQFGFAISKSPLDYHGHRPNRMEILHPGLPPAAEGTSDHITGYERTVSRSPKTGKRYKTPKVEPVPGAHPKAAGFIDFTPTSSGPYIHYMQTRSDLQGQGVGRQMVDKFYEHHKDAQEVDWGRVMHPGAEAMFHDRRAQQDKPGYKGPRTYGKLH